MSYVHKDRLGARVPKAVLAARQLARTIQRYAHSFETFHRDLSRLHSATFFRASFDRRGVGSEGHMLLLHSGSSLAFSGF